MFPVRYQKKVVFTGIKLANQWLSFKFGITYICCHYSVSFDSRLSILVVLVVTCVLTMDAQWGKSKEQSVNICVYRCSKVDQMAMCTLHQRDCVQYVIEES